MSTTTYDDAVTRLATRRRRQLAEQYQDAIRAQRWDECRRIAAEHRAETEAARGPSVGPVRKRALLALTQGSGNGDAA